MRTNRVVFAVAALAAVGLCMVDANLVAEAQDGVEPNKSAVTP